MVLDADALNAVAHKPAVLTQAKAPVVVTPHPGEMARLCGETAAQIQSHRWASARQFAWSYKTLTVLKGAGTVVARPDSQQVWLNATGNAGLAKGGTGDVLTGLLGGLLAQGLAPFDAARAAVYLHGLAADVAVNSAGINERSLLASDLLTAISGAFNSLQAASAQP
jgi:NAD(P)H-hydrate epimerase